METVLKEFRHDKVLLVYRCGSYAFGTSNESSDRDFVVVLKDYRGMTHRSEEGSEYFIFGLPFWKDKMEFSDDLAEYYEAFNDEVLSFPDSIVFIDEEIRPLVEKYTAEFPERLNKWLKVLVAYFSVYVAQGSMEKRFYHLVRVKHIVERYRKTGVLSLEIAPEVARWISEYKAAANRDNYKEDVHNALEYLRKQTEVAK